VRSSAAFIAFIPSSMSMAIRSAISSGSRSAIQTMREPLPSGKTCADPL
jgi:hypothetical protein